MTDKFIEAVDTRSGKKRRIPAQWVDLFPHFKPRKHHRNDNPKTALVTEPKPPQIPAIKHETKES